MKLRFGAYIFWGLMTTLVNMAAYWVFRVPASVYLEAANALAWLCAVLFAYVTNRIFVFPDKASSKKHIPFELARFLLSRGFSGALDMVLMFITVRFMAKDEFVMKAAVNLVVIIVNYVTSSFLVFRERPHDQKN